jgi:hypothetical protein
MIFSLVMGSNLIKIPATEQISHPKPQIYNLIESSTRIKAFERFNASILGSQWRRIAILNKAWLAMIIEERAPIL